MKKIITVSIVAFILGSCAQMQQVLESLPQNATLGQGGISSISNSDISAGLKQALNLGVSEGINKLGQSGGFFNNATTRILLPKELQVVDKTLRKFGMGKLADKGLKLLNESAEDAVKTATPIFSKAIQNMTITDAKNILLGNSNSATSYLENATTTQLVSSFRPNIQRSLGKVGADKVWKELISQYNLFTGNHLNTDLSGYVTEQAIQRVFKMVANKEQDIRKNVGARTTHLLQKVFALQDR
ncbi:MAG: DUF4197 domain-containing protein [Flavobacteriaceae bacterium]|nr:DUF4197 domain-containing protein [Flavobacteriaceae bacterium]